MEKTCRACGHTAEVESDLSTCPQCDRVYAKTEAAYERQREAKLQAAQDRQKAEKREARAVAKVQGAFPSAGTGRAVVQPVVLSSVQLPFWHLVGLIFKIMLASLIVTFVLMPLFLGAVFAGVTMYGMVVGSMVGG